MQAVAEQPAMAAQCAADAAGNSTAAAALTNGAVGMQPTAASMQQQQQQPDSPKAAAVAPEAGAEGHSAGPDCQACEVCHSTAFVQDSTTDPQVMLLCEMDGCCNGRHLGCCSPPLPEVPEEPFFCAACQPAARKRLCMVRCRRLWQRMLDCSAVSAKPSIIRNYAWLPHDRLCSRSVYCQHVACS